MGTLLGHSTWAQYMGTVHGHSAWVRSAWIVSKGAKRRTLKNRQITVKYTFKVLSGDVTFPALYWKSIGEHTQDLVRSGSGSTLK